jgi:hypothetical protein
MALRKFPTWATGSALLGNGDPDKQDPGQIKQDLGWVIEKPLVQYMNWIQNLVGKWIKSNNETAIQATTYEAEAGETILLDNSSAAAVGNLPASPIDRQKVVFGGVALHSVNNLTVQGNGNDIMEVGVDAILLDYDGRMFEFTWDGTTSLWEISVGDLRGKV